MSKRLVESGMNRSRRRMVREKQTACYHLVSRAPFGIFFMKSVEAREKFLQMLAKQAGFCGVEVLAFCLMSNHIHLLVRIPFIEAVEISDELLLKRYKCLYGGAYVPFSSYTLSEARDVLAADGDQADALRSALKRRMGSVSVFMRELKQRYAVWYNNAHNNKGAVWSGRFQSQIIQDDPACLQMVAAYIDLNPVRANMVNDPKDYPFSSFGAAMLSKANTRHCYCGIFGAENSDAAIRHYQQFIYAKGANTKNLSVQSGKSDRGVIFLSPILSEIEFARERINHRCDHFIRGGAFGSEEFVEAVFYENRAMFGEFRDSGGRRIRGDSDSSELRVLRDLRSPL